MNEQKPSPFSVIPVTPSQSIKVWDFMVKSRDGLFGRVRVLAVVPKRPAPLQNIPLSIAWCAPEDVNKFSKAKANKILVGRFMKAFQFCEEPNYCDMLPSGNTGIVIGPIPTLHSFGIDAMLSVNVPMWVDIGALWDEAEPC